MDSEIPTNPELYLQATAFTQATKEFLGIQAIEADRRDGLFATVEALLPDPSAFDSRDFLGLIAGLLDEYGLETDTYLEFLVQKGLLEDWDADTSYQNSKPAGSF